MNKFKLIFLFLLFGNGIVFSQDRPLNNIGINLVGDVHVSIHYEKLQLTDKSYIFGYKLGIGYNQEFQLCIFLDRVHLQLKII